LADQVRTSLREDAQRAVSFTLINSIAGSVWMPRLFRYFIYRLARMDIRTAKVAWHVTFLSRQVRICENVLINWGCIFEGGPITVGPNTLVGPEVAFITADHARGSDGKASGQYRSLPIEIGADCWLGARAMVLGGVRIADGCVVGAGAVVTKNLDVPGVYAGSPAKLIRRSGPARGGSAVEELQTHPSADGWAVLPDGGQDQVE
jgi:acetyltransferase-like isoleucine patch superfamily enzyme